jgi:hypothetical protein
MRIITNNQPRDLVSWQEIPASAQEWFDYLSEDERYDYRLTRYRGSWYDVSQFVWTGPNEAWGTGNPELASLGWDGYHTDTFFSAVVARYVSDNGNERVVMGLALS